MTNLIRWSEIESEAQGFRQGLVALFRKYEGQPTDEKDAYGRTVKVTPASFARHMGVEPSTFRRWVKKASTVLAISTEESKQKTKEIEQWHLRSAARKNPQALVEAISDLPEEHQRDIVRQVHRKQLERAGADFSESGRKAREARTSEHFEPLRQSLNAIKVIATLERAAEELRNLPPDLSDQDRDDITAAIDDVVLARMEFDMRYEVER
jgi:hypothetical protein